jgi:hypothetical protein
MSLGTLTNIPGSAGFPARGLVFITVWSSLVFQDRNFGQTAPMTLRTAESREEKCLNQLFSQPISAKSNTSFFMEFKVMCSLAASVIGGVW